MAAITVVPVNLGWTQLRNVTAQATTGQTDWIGLPVQAHYASIYISLTDVGVSTTPILLPSLLFPDPVVLQDSASLINLGEHTAFTGITAAAQYVFDIGPGVTGIANDVTNSASADSYVALNVNLPPVLGIKILNDRTTGDEVYTYTVGIWVKP